MVCPYLPQLLNRKGNRYCEMQHLAIVLKCINPIKMVNTDITKRSSISVNTPPKFDFFCCMRLCKAKHFFFFKYFNQGRKLTQILASPEYNFSIHLLHGFIDFC